MIATQPDGTWKDTLDASSLFEECSSPVIFNFFIPLSCHNPITEASFIQETKFQQLQTFTAYSAGTSAMIATQDSQGFSVPS